MGINKKAMKIETLVIGAAIGYFLAKATAKDAPGIAPQLPFQTGTPQRKQLGNIAGCNCANGTRLFQNRYFSSDSERIAKLTA